MYTSKSTVYPAHELMVGCTMQLCVEHGISNDGILEDFATQVRACGQRLMGTCAIGHQGAGACHHEVGRLLTPARCA